MTKIPNVSYTQLVQSKLPAGGVTIFSVMSRLAEDVGAINLGQGFPDFNSSPRLIDASLRLLIEDF